LQYEKSLNFVDIYSGNSLVKSLIKRAVESTIKKIETPATSALLEQQKDAVMCLMLEACEKKLDSLREMDKKTFEVPSHVLLIKDFDLEHQLSNGEEEMKAAQLEELKLRCCGVSIIT